MSRQRLRSPRKRTRWVARSESRSDYLGRVFDGEIHSPILQLQQTLGNQRVAQLIHAKGLTPDGKIIGLRRKATVGAAHDQYEQEADRVASQVMNPPDAVTSHLAKTDRYPQSSRIERKCSECEKEIQRQLVEGEGLQKQPTEKAGTVKFSPVVSAYPSEVALETDKTAEVRFQVDNFKEARGMKIDLGGGTQNSQIVEFLELKRDARHGKATMTIKGKGAGSALINGTALAANGEAKAAWVPVTVSSDASRAAKTLKSLSERRRKGERIEDREQVRAEKEAVAGAEKLAGRAKGSHGTEIEAVIRSILDQISRIESARARGYLQAVGDLSAKGLDKEADYGAFAQSLAGNLLWALSGVLPAAPLGALAISGLRTFFKTKWTAPGPGWAAVVGTVGAMTAQFSAGFPSGASSSALKVAMEKSLTSINADICNGLRRAAYEYLADAVAASPPELTTDAQQYAADLELGLRHALYGDIYTKGLNDGDQPQAGKVQQDARDQLLRQYVVANAALSEGEVAATRAMGGTAEVGAAVDLLGGKQALKLEAYELIANQMRTAAADIGCEINVDPRVAASLLTQGKDIYADVTSFNYRVLFSGPMPSKWFQMVTDKILKLNPEFANEAYLGGITKMNRVTVQQKDLASAEISGKKVYSAKYLHFSATGSGQREGDFIRVNVPSAFDIRYRIAPVTSHEKWWGGEP